MTTPAPSDDYRSGHRLTVRILQTAPRLGHAWENLAEIDRGVAEADGVDLVVTPELATHGYHLSEVPDVEGFDPGAPELAAVGRHGRAAVIGFAERWRHHMFNSAAVVADGRVEVQRKLYLPNYRSWEERKHFRPGGRIRTFDVLGSHLSVLICNDLWQPAVPWLAAHSGAEVLVSIANSSRSEIGRRTEEVWDVLLQHSAIALQCYVVFVNRVGTEAGSTFWGGSRVISPLGEDLGRLGEEPGTLDCTLDLSELRLLRRRWPLLQESRADVIAAEASRLAGEDF